MIDCLKPGQLGDHILDNFHVDGETFYAIYNGIDGGDYTRLRHLGEVVMSDTPMEKRTNYFVMKHAYGDVLIGGLGIGMILLELDKNPAVTSITVLEKYSDVIQLVGSQLPLSDKVRIIHADVFDWKPPKGVRYDCIYMDIWNYINHDVYKDEMVPLKRKFSHYLKPKDISPNRFNKCWAEYHAKHERPLR